MIKYKVTFELNIEDVLEYDTSDQHAEILEIDDECFDKTFDTEDKIKDFQEWYNFEMADDEEIEIIDIVYDRDGENLGILEVSTENEIKDKETFAAELVDYLFDTYYPTVRYQVTGTAIRDYWNYYAGSPAQETIEVDYEDSATIDSYHNVVITEI